MSAFAGIVRWDGRGPLDPGDSARLISAATATGHLKPTIVSAPPLVAALAERGRSSSRQKPDGPIVSLFDGRVDDRVHLAARLNLSDREPDDKTLVLAAFDRWGTDAPREMLGEFAWAIWDAANACLILARDPSASRSLYYYRDTRLVAFATSVRALLALPDVPRDLDRQALAEFVALHPGMGDRTVYRDIRHVLPGTTAIITAERLRLEANWRPFRRPGPVKPSEWTEGARELLERAICDRARTGPVAVSLSGGLDSSIVAGVAAAVRAPESVLGIALVPGDQDLAVHPGWVPDGRPQLEALARCHGNLRIDHIMPPVHRVDVDPTHLFVATGQPIGLAPNIGWLLGAWQHAQAAGVQMLMTGDEGEMSITHRGSLSALVRQGEPARAALEAWRLARWGQGRLRDHIDMAFFGGTWNLIRGKGPRPGDWRHYSPIHPDFAQEAGVTELLIEEGFPGGFRHRPPGYREAVDIYMRRRAGTVDNIAALRALTGVDHTSPFSDRRVVDFCLSLPERAFVRDGRFRWLAREAFRDVLPKEVRDNSVKAEQNAEWFHNLRLRRDRLHEQLEEIETSPLARQALDLPRLKRLLDQWPATAEAATAAGPAYRSTLVRGLHVGSFLRWLDPSNGG